jgi:hypothetical protein
LLHNIDNQAYVCYNTKMTTSETPRPDGIDPNMLSGFINLTHIEVARNLNDGEPVGDDTSSLIVAGRDEHLHPDYDEIDEEQRTLDAQLSAEEVPEGVGSLKAARLKRERVTKGVSSFSVEHTPFQLESAPAPASGYTRKMLGKVATNASKLLTATRAHDMTKGDLSRRKQIAFDRSDANGNKPGTREHSSYFVPPEQVVANKIINKVAKLFPTPNPMDGISSVIDRQHLGDTYIPPKPTKK